MLVRFTERTQRAIYAWVLLGLVAYIFLPWYYLQKGNLLSALPNLFDGQYTSNGLTHAFFNKRYWLLSGFLGFFVAGLGAIFPAGKLQGRVLIIGSSFGIVGLVASGFGIGAVGWNFTWLDTLFGQLQTGQYGIGWGGFFALLSLLMIFGAGLARCGYFKGDVFVAAAVIGSSALIALFVAYPVLKSLLAAFVGETGEFEWDAIMIRIGTERVWGLGCLGGGKSCGVGWNTLFLACLTALGTTILGTMIALISERGANKRLKKPLNILAMLPIITPPFVVGLGLILLFGRAGIFNQFLEWAFNIQPTRWFYGLFGVWLAQLFAFTPIAFMIMKGVVQGVSPSLEEAAQTLRANRMRTFMTVTLPLLAPGLANAFLVGFIESIADFGNPIILGEGYSVLSTEIFFAIVGASLDPGMAAALALILTFFALAVFSIQRSVLSKNNFTTVSGKGDAGIPMVLPSIISKTCNWIAGPWLIFTAIVYIFAFSGGFVKIWGRDYSFTLDHFIHAFSIQLGSGGIIWSGVAWDSLFNTLTLAAIAAPICSILGMLIAWLLARTEFKGKSSFEFSALLTFAIPGTVLGVSYIMAFNVPPVELTGTGLLIIICFIFRNLPVGVRAGAASFKQLDRSLDEASVMLRASSFTTLRRVILPLIKPALVTSLVYSFVRSMTTVSAVIFLVTAEYDLSTTFIIGRVGSGDYGLALAYCTVLIILMSTITVLIQKIIGERKIGRRE